MNCREIKRKLSAYQDSELPGAQRDEIEHHLKNCAECLSAYQKMDQVGDLLSNVETIESAPYFYTRLAQRMNKTDRKQPGWNFIFAPVQKLSFSIVVVCLIVFGLAIGVYLGQNIYQHSQLTANAALDQELDQVFPMGSFEDFPEQSVAQVYVTMLSENNNH